MKLTRIILRQLIIEAVKRRSIFPNPDNPVTQSELDQIRDQSRQRAGIPDVTRGKIRSLEVSKHPNEEPSEEDINQARFLAKSLGSDQGEISAMEEDNFFRAQTMHEMLPIFEPIFGQAVYSLDPKLLKKIYTSTTLAGRYEVWIYDMITGQERPDQEAKATVLEKLKRGDYVIYSFGRERSDYAMFRISHQDFTNLQNRIKRNLPLPPDYYIFKMLTELRPDLDVWSAN